MTWKVFEDQASELATLGVEKLNKKIAYLATIKKDGSPRLHPVTPFIGQGMLFIFTEPSSPKIGDIKRDGRYCFHCSVGGEGPLQEYQVSGHAEVITDPEVRKQAQAIADSPVVTDGYVLFEFHVENVLAVEYDKEGKSLVRRWKREKGE